MILRWKHVHTTHVNKPALVLLYGSLPSCDALSEAFARRIELVVDVGSFCSYLIVDILFKIQEESVAIGQP